MFTFVPLHILSEVGFGVTTGTGSIVTVVPLSPETVFPQASVIVGAGTSKVPPEQVEGQLGMVSANVSSPKSVQVDVL
jgi:hypothetical protein